MKIKHFTTQSDYFSNKMCKDGILFPAMLTLHQHTSTAVETSISHPLKSIFQALTQLTVKIRWSNYMSTNRMCAAKTLISKHFVPYQENDKEEVCFTSFYIMFYKHRCEEIDTGHLNIPYHTPIESSNSILRSRFPSLGKFIDNEAGEIYR